jgi:hypothetical protein
VRDISTSVVSLGVTLSYIISACDNKEPPVAVHPSSTSLRVCRECRAKTRFNAALYAYRIRLGLQGRTLPCAGLKQTIRGAKVSAWLALWAWLGRECSKCSATTDDTFTSKYTVNLHLSILHSFLRRQLALLDLSPIEAV